MSGSRSCLGASAGASRKSAAPLTAVGLEVSLGVHTSLISQGGHPEKPAEKVKMW